MTNVTTGIVTSALVSLFECVVIGKTRRMKIMADRDTTIRKINAQAKILHTIIARGHKERKMVIEGMLKKMDGILNKKSISDNEVKCFEMLTSVINTQIQNPQHLPVFQKKLYELIE